MKEKVLILTGFYIPSIKGGGPIQSIKNLVEQLSDEYDFYILTSDRDLGDKDSFETVKKDEWISVGKTKVFYTNSKKLTILKITRIINNIKCDTLYLNGFFIYKFSILPIVLKRLRLLKLNRIIVAPRGEFSEGALNLKKTKKNIYIKLAKFFKLYKNVRWHVTADVEQYDVQRVFGNSVEIFLANNLTEDYQSLEYNKTLKKERGSIKLVFVSRVHPKKNLKRAIEFLIPLKGDVEFNIYGPIEDKSYWAECKMLISKLPLNIKVNYKGALNHEEIMNIFTSHHFFIFPTLGENFGHVISEALIGGCPIIISDQTPWKNLDELNVGWDIPLNNEAKFINIIQNCTDLDNDEYKRLSMNAFQYGKQKSNDLSTIRNYNILFSQY